MAKTLIAFFSRADENYFGGAMRYVKVGNTEIVVDLMKELILWQSPHFSINMILRERRYCRFVQMKEAAWDQVSGI